MGFVVTRDDAFHWHEPVQGMGIFSPATELDVTTHIQTLTDAPQTGLSYS